MRFGITLMGDRVAPRCTFAHSILVVVTSQGRITYRETVPLESNTIIDLISVLRDYQVDTLICGGISIMEIRELNQSLRIGIIDNVTGGSDEIVNAVENSKIHPDSGLSYLETGDAVYSTIPIDEQSRSSVRESPDQVSGNMATEASISDIDCLNCKERVCLQGKMCSLGLMSSGGDLSGERLRILQSIASLARKHEGKLCRLAEMVDFCLEMKYEKVGVAFCIDFLKHAEIVTGVLRRFFKVFPVCCQVIGSHEGEASPDNIAGAGQVQRPGLIPCNPVVQAEILNQADTDLNVTLGLSIGADCLFTQSSRAPVTTLFVKDRLVEDNPICAAYSKNYLAEIAGPQVLEYKSQ